MSSEKHTLVLMAGLPGTGKSAIAYKLRQKLEFDVLKKCFIIKKDGYMEDLLSSTWDYWRAGYDTYEQVFRLAKYMLSEQFGSVILDSAALEPFILEKANELLSEVPNVQ